MQKSWSIPVTKDEAYKRAGGRRRYNTWRQRQANHRRHTVIDLAMKGHKKAEIARALGVHRSTIGRDFEAIPMLNLLDLFRKLGTMNAKLAKFMNKKKRGRPRRSYKLR